MPTYTPETRQLRIHTSMHERVRIFAAANGVRIRDVYRRLANAAIVNAVEHDPVIRVVAEIPDDTWEAMGERALAAGVTRSELIEQSVAALNTKEPAA